MKIVTENNLLFEVSPNFDEKTLDDLLSTIHASRPCPYCGSFHVVSNGTRGNGVKRFKCKDCNKSFTSFTGTIFDKTKISIQAWLIIVEGMLVNKTLQEVCDDLESINEFLTQKTIYEAEKAILTSISDLPKSDLEGVIEFNSFQYLGNIGMKITKEGEKEIKKYGLQTPHVLIENIEDLPDTTYVLSFIDENENLLLKTAEEYNPVDFIDIFKSNIKNYKVLCHHSDLLLRDICNDENILDIDFYKLQQIKYLKGTSETGETDILNKKLLPYKEKLEECMPGYRSVVIEKEILNVMMNKKRWVDENALSLWLDWIMYINNRFHLYFKNKDGYSKKGQIVIILEDIYLNQIKRTI